MESRLVQGMLIASCVCLLLAVGVTWMDISKYRAAGAPAPLPAVTAPSAPGPVAPEPAQPATEATPPAPASGS